MKQLLCAGVAMLSLAYTVACLLAFFAGAMPVGGLLVRAASSITIELAALSEI